ASPPRRRRPRRCSASRGCWCCDGTSAASASSRRRQPGDARPSGGAQRYVSRRKQVKGNAPPRTGHELAAEPDPLQRGGGRGARGRGAGRGWRRGGIQSGGAGEGGGGEGGAVGRPRAGRRAGSTPARRRRGARGNAAQWVGHELAAEPDPLRRGGGGGRGETR